MRDRLWSGLLLSALATLWPSVAAAQDRPFAFATSPAAWERDGALVFFEPAWADAAPEAMARDGFASRMGFEARVARREVSATATPYALRWAPCSRRVV